MRIVVPALLWLGVWLQTPPAIALHVDARRLQPGELVVLTIDTPAPIADVRIRAFGHDVPAYRVDAAHCRALIGIDLDVAPGSYPITVQAGAARGTQTLRVLAHAFPTRRLSVDPAFVNPPPEAEARIEADAKLLNAVWAHPAPSRLWSGAFTRPVPQPNNSAFGTRSVFNGQPRSAHGGADFLSPAGTPVAAPNAGRVVVARDLYYTGGTVVIDHGLGLFSLFAHLSRIDVHEGDDVTTGTTVGLVGATGRVTGPHLHWTARVGSARIDPLSILTLLN